MNFFKKIFGMQPKDSAEADSKKEVSRMDVDAEFQKTISLLEKFRRTAYLPKTIKVEPEFSAKSKIGGFPYLRNQNDWPVCSGCNKNMQLFLQLNLSELPERKENGLIQLFYCTTLEPSCESEQEAYFAFSEAVVCRKIEINGESASIEPKTDSLFDEKQIIDWEPKDDYPHFEEYQLLGIDLEPGDDVYMLMEERKVGFPIDKDKLFGWPYWVQSVEYPFDRKTETQMQLLFQLASENNLPYMFGDAGIGHLTQSTDNAAELAFGWACY